MFVWLVLVLHSKFQGRNFLKEGRMLKTNLFGRHFWIFNRIFKSNFGILDQKCI